MRTLFNASDYLAGDHVRAGRGDRTAFVCNGEPVTYAEFFERVCAAATALRDLGVQPEQRVVLVLRDGIEFAASFLGAMRIGAIPVPVNPLLSAGDLVPSAADARARVAIVDAARGTLAADFSSGAPEVTDVIVAGGDPSPGATTGVRAHRWDDLMSHMDAGAAYPTWGESPGFWQCTSGTTGVPKLAMHRHADLPAIAEGYAREVLAIAPEDRCFSVAPMFHGYGFGNSVVFPLSVGASAILEPTRPPTPDLVARILARDRPTLFFAVPTFYAALLAADLPADTFASVRCAVSAGEALPAELFTRFRARFGVELLDGIGSTEMCHIFISNRPGAAIAGTLGRPVAGHRVRLVDEDGAELPPEVPGQLLVAGEAAATGYYCRSDATRSTFLGEWVRTGDMYTRSADGVFTYLGRSDDMMKVSGEWVSPAEVEAVLAECTGVLEAAVVGEPDADGLIRPVAYVVASPGTSIEADDVIEFCRGKLAGFKRPRRVVVVAELPKTVTGKIRRAAIRQQAAATTLADATR